MTLYGLREASGLCNSTSIVGRRARGVSCSLSEAFTYKYSIGTSESLPRADEFDLANQALTPRPDDAPSLSKALRLSATRTLALNTRHCHPQLFRRRILCASAAIMGICDSLRRRQTAMMLPSRMVVMGLCREVFLGHTPQRPWQDCYVR